MTLRLRIPAGVGAGTSTRLLESTSLAVVLPRSFFRYGMGPFRGSFGSQVQSPVVEFPLRVPLSIQLVQSFSCSPRFSLGHVYNQLEGGVTITQANISGTDSTIGLKSGNRLHSGIGGVRYRSILHTCRSSIRNFPPSRYKAEHPTA